MRNFKKRVDSAVVITSGFAIEILVASAFIALLATAVSVLTLSV